MQQEERKSSEMSRSNSQERSTSNNRPQSPFSPQNTSQMSNFFNPRGPIKPQNLFIQSQQEMNSSNQRDFLRANAQQQPQHHHSQQQIRAQIPTSQMYLNHQPDEEEYFDEDDEEDLQGQGRAGQKVLSPEQEQMIIRRLFMNSQRNQEFLKVLNILQNDDELRPLIFEHEALLNTLKEMMELKAEQMLSILTAAETEMYENSRQKEEQQQQQQQQQSNIKSNVQTDSKAVSVNLISAEDTQEFLEKTQTATFEIEALKKQMFSLEKEKLMLTTELTKEREQREKLEKEQECAFKNLTEENKQLKVMNDTLKKQESETKKQLEIKEREFIDEVSGLRKKLKQQEDLRVSMMEDKNKIEENLKKNQEFIDNLEQEIQLLEKDNENLHRKMNLTYNSLLFSHGLQQYTQQPVIGEQSTPARRNLSNSFQASMNTEGFKNGNSMVIHGGIGQSTQKLKLLMSENRSANSFVGNSLYYAHHFGGHQRGDSNQLPRSNSIEVILLDDDECRKQNLYQLGEEEKQSFNVSYMLQNKASWLKTKGLFTDLSPINSLSSQNVDQTSRRTNSYQQKQQFKKLHDVEEEHTEILGTHAAGSASPYQPTRYYDEQVRKLQLEIEKLKDQNKDLTQKLVSQQFISGTGMSMENESPSRVLQKQTHNDLLFGTPQNNTNYRFHNDTGASHPNHYISNQLNQQLNSNDPSPMMATFSKEKDRQFYSQQFNQIHSQQSSLPQHHQQSESERERFLEQQYERLSHEFKARLQELGSRLLTLLRKVLPQQGSVDISPFSNQEFSVSLLKDIIYEIGAKIDSMFDQSQNQRSRVMSQGVFTNNNSNNNQMFYGGSGFNNLLHPQSHGFGSHNNSTTMDMSPLDIKNLLLEEKEKRLQVQEELNKTKEQHLRYISENEKLKQELMYEKQNNQSMVMSHYDYHSTSFEQVNKLNQQFQQKIDTIQDENITLKLKIAELEDDLLNERQSKQVKYESTLESFKSNIQGQYLDQKIRYEEQLLAEKDTTHKLKVEIKGLLERNEILKDQLQLFRERIQELEKESIQQSKENYVLQNELDYENLRASQLQTRQDKIKQDVQSTIKQDIMKVDQIILKYENKLKDMQFKLNEQEILYSKQVEIERMIKDRYEDEIAILKCDVARMHDELSQLKLKKHVNNFIEEKSEKIGMKETAVGKIRTMANFKLKLAMLKRFYHLRLLSIQSKVDNQQTLFRQQVDSFAVSESNIQRIQQLEESIYRGQTDQSSMARVIAKMLRYVQKKEPIKLNLSGLINKQSLDYILSGLKFNTDSENTGSISGACSVTELNLSKCNLDDEDLQKIYEHLRSDQGIKCFKIGNNKFTNLQPLLDLLMAKGKKLTALDIEGCQFTHDIDTFDRLPQVLRRMDSLQELNIAAILPSSSAEMNSYPEQVNKVIDAVLSLRNLKALDVSKNAFSGETLEHLMYSVKIAPSIEAIVMNSVGLNEQVFDSLLFMVQNQRNLRKLNISGNSNLTSHHIIDLLRQLTTSASTLEDLDLSKCKLNNDSQCYTQLAEFIKTNKSLRVLALQKVNMNDTSAQMLVNALKEAMNLQTLKLDYNQLGFVFIEKMVQKMVSNKLVNNYLQQPNNSSSSSLLDSDSSRATNSNQKPLKKQTGLLYLSFEGNTIGDQGASAIAQLIRQPCDNAKQLNQVNLNQCGITSEGFEELRNALMQRANLASTANLSHVKITIERNNIDF